MKICFFWISQTCVIWNTWTFWKSTPSPLSFVQNTLPSGLPCMGQATTVAVAYHHESAKGHRLDFSNAQRRCQQRRRQWRSRHPQSPDECLASVFPSLSSTVLNRCSLVCWWWIQIDGQSRHCISLNVQSVMILGIHRNPKSKVTRVLPWRVSEGWEWDWVVLPIS